MEAANARSPSLHREHLISDDVLVGSYHLFCLVALVGVGPLLKGEIILYQILGCRTAVSSNVYVLSRDDRDKFQLFH